VTFVVKRFLAKSAKNHKVRRDYSGQQLSDPFISGDCLFKCVKLELNYNLTT